MFENTGNIPIHAKLVLKEFAPKGPSYSSPDTGKIIIIPANSKTAKITLFVKPQESGDINCTLELHTDIRSRVRNSPTDSIIRFDIKGRGQAPVLVKDQVAIEFKDIVVPSEREYVCDSISKIRTIKITNTGNLPLDVSTPEFLSPVGKGDYDISPKSKLTIKPNTSQSYLLSFLPKSKTSGISKDTLIFLSNSVRDANAKFQQRDTIFLSGNGIVPENISLSIGKVKSAPSKKVLIPIYIDSGSTSLTYASSFKTSILYDNSYAFRFDTVYTEGTATANSNISITKKTLGSSIQIELDIKSKSNSFIDNPILANLVYDTYIAAPGSVDIIIKHDINQIKNPTQFGRGDCPNFFKVNPPISGSFTLDSVCGEGYKAVHNAKGGFTFDVYQAMNHSEQALIHCSSPYDIRSKIIICSVQGGELREVYNGHMISNEQISIPFSTEFLSPGIYYCIFRAGIFTNCKPLIINR